MNSNRESSLQYSLRLATISYPCINFPLRRNAFYIMNNSLFKKPEQRKLRIDLVHKRLQLFLKGLSLAGWLLLECSADVATDTSLRTENITKCAQENQETARQEGRMKVQGMKVSLQKKRRELQAIETRGRKLSRKINLFLIKAIVKALRLNRSLSRLSLNIFSAISPT